MYCENKVYQKYYDASMIALNFIFPSSLAKHHIEYQPYEIRKNMQNKTYIYQANGKF